jgi:hypothetical protein
LIFKFAISIQLLTADGEFNYLEFAWHLHLTPACFKKKPQALCYRGEMQRAFPQEIATRLFVTGCAQAGR